MWGNGLYPWRPTAIKGDPDRLEEWANRNLTKTNTAKSQVLQLGRKSPLQRSRLGAACLAGEQISRNAPAVAADSELGMSQRCAWAARKANSIQGCVNRVTASRLRERVFLLYSALMPTHLNTASSFGLPNARKTLRKWSKFNRGLPRQYWGWRTCLINRALGNGASWA